MITVIPSSKSRGQEDTSLIAISLAMATGNPEGRIPNAAGTLIVHFVVMKRYRKCHPSEVGQDPWPAKCEKLP